MDRVGKYECNVGTITLAPYFFEDTLQDNIKGYKKKRVSNARVFETNYENLYLYVYSPYEKRRMERLPRPRGFP